MPGEPTPPEPSQWNLPDPRDAPTGAGELIGAGADLEPGTLLAAYRCGLFPMPLPEELRVAVEGLTPIGWWSPNPRGILPLDGLIVSRSLRKSCGKFEIRVDTAFDDVIGACSDPARAHGWIDDDMITAYSRLFDMGWAHSVEAWNVETGRLAGGLYGIAIGAFFAGESMFHWETDASKVSLAGLVRLLSERHYQLLDTQWMTDHLASLGVIEIPRTEYLDLLKSAVDGSAEALGALDEPLHL